MNRGVGGNDADGPPDTPAITQFPSTGHPPEAASACSAFYIGQRSRTASTEVVHLGGVEVA